MKSNLKEYKPDRGVLMDSNFENHAAHCESCKLFAPDRPATAAHLCLEGSVLWKRDNPAPRSRAEVPRDEHYCTKGEMKRLKRYRGE